MASLHNLYLSCLGCWPTAPNKGRGVPPKMPTRTQVKELMSNPKAQSTIIDMLNKLLKMIEGKTESECPGWVTQNYPRLCEACLELVCAKDNWPAACPRWLQQNHPQLCQICLETVCPLNL